MVSPKAHVDNKHKRHRRSYVHSTGIVWALLAPLLLAGRLAPQPASSPETTDLVQTEMQSVQELLAQATTEFEGPRQGRSIVLLDRIIERLEELRRRGLLPLHGKEILAQVYDLQARAYFNIGLQEKAAQVFRQLIQLQPQYTLQKEQVSPKIVDFFNSVKKALVGYLAVSSDPPGARVMLNGEFLSITDFFPIEVLAGEYALEILREGYETVSRTVSIAPRATETIEVKLVRTAASGFFVSQPPGVEIWIDGVLRATTGGSLHPTMHEQLAAAGFDPARTSARTEVPNVALGSHVIEFRKQCYELIKTSIDVPEAKDYDIEPVRLEESRAALRLTSEPPGARIFLDGEPKGVTPAYFEGMCSGVHHLEVKHAAGKFVQEITLARNEELSLDCPIRPSLAFLGVVEGAAAERFLAETEERLGQQLGKVRSLNIVRPRRERVKSILESEGLTLADLLPNAGKDPERIRKATEKLAAALEAQGFLIAALPQQQILRNVSMSLLAAGSSAADTRDALLGDTSSTENVLAALDRSVHLARPWAGLITADTKRGRGLPILRLVPDGPAEKAGLRVGESVISADGKALASTQEFLGLVAAKKPGATMSLVVEQSGTSRMVEITLEETRIEVALDDPAILYNRLMLDLRQDLDGRPETEPAAYALDNLGLCAMHFGDLVAAHEYFLRAARDLPQRSGLGRGTAFYRLGVVLDRLGYTSEAAESYRSAAAVSGATIIDNDGPLVSDLIPSSPGQ